MPTGFVRTAGTRSIPIWQGGKKDISIAQGGFQLVTTGYVPGQLIPAGTPMKFDEAARTATVGSGGGNLQLAATGNPVVYRVNKGHTLQVGQFMALTVGSAAYAITAIDISNAAYDAVTVGTTLGNAIVGAAVFQSSATGANAAAYDAAINGLLYDDRTVPVVGVVDSASVVIRGIVYARRLPWYTAGLAAITALKNIIWSQSK